MAPSGSIWHKESLKLKEIFGTREGFEICPNNFSPRPNFSPPCSSPHPPGYLGGALRAYSEVKKRLPPPPPPLHPQRTGFKRWACGIMCSFRIPTGPPMHVRGACSGTCTWVRLVCSSIISTGDLNRLAPTFRTAYAGGVDRLQRFYAGTEVWATEAPCDMGSWARAWAKQHMLRAVARDSRVTDSAVTAGVGGISQAEYPEMGSRICTQTPVEEVTSSGTDAAPYPLGCLPV